MVLLSYNMLMAHDDDTDEFLGITFIPHGDNHSKAPASEQSDETKPAKTKQHTKRTHDEADEIKALQEEIIRLENTLQIYELETEERLKHLERLAGHPLTAEEKVYRIQESA